MNQLFDDPMDEAEYWNDQEQDRIIRGAFTENPDEWIYSVFERLDSSERHETAQKIEEALAFFKTGDDWKPSVHALKLLEVLDTATTPLAQVEIETRMPEVGHSITRKTFGPVLRTLEEKGLVSHPGGVRKGVVITQAGRQLLHDSNDRSDRTSH